MTECDPATAASLLLIFSMLLHVVLADGGILRQIAPKMTRLAPFASK